MSISEYDLSIQEIISVDKVSRLIRKIVTKYQLLEDPKDRLEMKMMLEHKDYKWFRENYGYVYQKYNKKLDMKYPKSHNDSKYKDYLYDMSYNKVKRTIIQKSLLQVYEWHEQRKPMIFQTLTVNDNNLNIHDINKGIRKYRQKLSEIRIQYVLIFERGSETGRVHFHCLHEMHPSIGIRCHGPWELGYEDHKLVKYLNDGITSDEECLINNWSLEAVSHYIGKYIQKDDLEIIDGFKYRTSTSRGFGTQTLRIKLCKTKTKILKKLLQTQLHHYLIPFQTEVKLELARRVKKTTGRLKDRSLTPKGKSLKNLISTNQQRIGRSKTTATAEQFDLGFNYYLKKNWGY